MSLPLLNSSFYDSDFPIFYILHYFLPFSNFHVHLFTWSPEMMHILQRELIAAHLLSESKPNIFLMYNLKNFYENMFPGLFWIINIYNGYKLDIWAWRLQFNFLKVYLLYFISFIFYSCIIKCLTVMEFPTILQWRYNVYIW